MYLWNPTPTTATLQAIPEGREGIRQTLAAMARFAREGKKSLRVRETALNLVGMLPQKDWVGQVKHLHEFVKNRIRYVRDIEGVETLHTPDKLLEVGQGDCDDKATLLAAMLKSIGHPARFVAVGFRPGKFVHVYVETKIGSEWVPLETTEPVPVGWSPPGVVSRMVFPV